MVQYIRKLSNANLHEQRLSWKRILMVSLLSSVFQNDLKVMYHVVCHNSEFKLKLTRITDLLINECRSKKIHYFNSVDTHKSKDKTMYKELIAKNIQLLLLVHFEIKVIRYLCVYTVYRH